MLQINLPFSYWSYKISGVYKLQFPDGCFYIGCSNHLRNRAKSWEALMKSKNHKNWVIGKRVMDKIKEHDSATFDIIELCNPKDLKDKESYYLHLNRENKQMVSDWDNGSWKPVLQYKEDGTFVKKHVSISAAAKYLNSPIGRIQDVLNKVRKSHKGMFFIFETDYGVRRKNIIKSRYITNEKKNKRDVVMFNKDGVELKRYKTIVAASVDNLISKTSITDALNGRQKTSQGYIWKYA